MLWWILKRSALQSSIDWYVNVILSTFAIKWHADFLMAAFLYLTKSTFFLSKKLAFHNVMSSTMRKEVIF